MTCAAKPLTEEEPIQKEAYIEQDFQQLVRAYEAYGLYVVFVLFGGSSVAKPLLGARPSNFMPVEIQDKTPEAVEKYYKTVEKKWHTLSGMIPSFA